MHPDSWQRQSRSAGRSDRRIPHSDVTSPTWPYEVSRGVDAPGSGTSDLSQRIQVAERRGQMPSYTLPHFSRKKNSGGFVMRHHCELASKAWATTPCISLPAVVECQARFTNPPPPDDRDKTARRTLRNARPRFGVDYQFRSIIRWPGSRLLMGVRTWSPIRWSFFVFLSLSHHLFSFVPPEPCPRYHAMSTAA